MKTPLFSIITITFNAEKALPPTLRSVDAQAFTDYEHLIIDGASRDNTAAVASTPENPRRRVFSEPDKGLYDAMNKGMAKARGQYLIFLNAGDSFTATDTLARYAAAAADDVDIIYADTQLVDDRRNLVGPRHLSVPEILTFKSFAQGMLVCHQAFCVRRSLAPDYDLQYRFSADYEWCLRCLQKTTPERTRNLHIIAIDYLTDGLTDKNHKASLKERYRIMSKYYGAVPTALRHIGFAFRAAMRCLKG
ncbi:MAG: glycosyltransferase [Prevotella sp.]|nr:glycosyltransferase [Prevotella sp.]MCM1074240.1 glycosyltransferase [Ruminococcus sp.]